MNTRARLDEVRGDASVDGLVAGVVSTLEFATRLVGRLDILMETWPVDAAQRTETADKILAESALLLLIVARSAAQLDRRSSSIITTSSDALRATLAPRVRSERASVMLLRSPKNAVRFGVPHIALSCAGEPDSTFDAYLETALEYGKGQGRAEQLPFRTLEDRWLRALVQGTSVECHDLLPNSILGGHVHPIYMDRIDVYAVTHWLMYVTDFGRVDPPEVIDRQKVRALLDAAIAFNLVIEDMDLLGELLMASHTLRYGWSPHCSAGWCVVSSAFRDLGFVPSPSLDPNEFENRTDVARSAYATAHIYHSQYVFGMLCAMLLTRSRDDKQTRNLAKPLAHDGVVELCLETAVRASRFCGAQVSEHERQRRPTVIDAADLSNFSVAAFSLLVSLATRSRNEDGTVESGDPPFWSSTLQRDRSTLIEALPVLLDAVLIKTAREYDLDALVKALCTTMALGLQPSETFKESLMFLCRQQTPVGAIGAYFVRDDNLSNPAARAVTSGITQTLLWAADYLLSDEADRAQSKDGDSAGSKLQ